MPAALQEILVGRRALVTGGTRGIGAATARVLADAGAQVLVSARTVPPDSPFPVITADMSDPDDVQALADSALTQLGGIDVLVSNVGGQIRRPGALQFTDEDWQQEIDLNLLAAVRLDRALVPAMLAQGAGAIVHVSSGAARIARPTSLPYSAAKAALNAYSKGLASELGAHGIRVNVVSPGFISTSRIAELAAEQKPTPKPSPARSPRPWESRWGAPAPRPRQPSSSSSSSHPPPPISPAHNSPSTAAPFPPSSSSGLDDEAAVRQHVVLRCRASGPTGF